MQAEQQNSRRDFDIIIVGGGMVGSILSALLATTEATRALNIALLDAGAEPELNSSVESVPGQDSEQFDPRVVALTRRSQKLLEKIDAWPEVLANRACAYTDMRVWDGDGTGSIHFNSFDVGEDNLGHIVENRVVLASIYRQLQSCSPVEIQFNAKVVQLAGSEEKRELILEDGQVLSAPLIIAADGGRSKIRQLAAIDVKEWSYHHQAIVTTVTCERPHEFTAWQRFTQTGPLAFLPLQQTAVAAKNEYHCSIVWSQEESVAEQLMSLTDEDFNAALTKAFEGRLGKVTHSDQRYCIPLIARHAREYFRPGLVLVGDAAHSIHPLAGQGVNLGFNDAETLVAEIQRAHNRGIALSDESILRRYQRARKPHNLAVLGLMEGFKQLFGADQLPMRLLRNIGLKQVNQLPWIKNAIAKEILGAEQGRGG